jgi:hypothetical protein
MFIIGNRVGIFRARIEGPQQFTGIHVKAADNARGSRVEKLSVTAGNHDGFIGDDRR